MTVGRDSAAAAVTVVKVSKVEAERPGQPRPRPFSSDGWDKAQRLSNEHLVVSISSKIMFQQVFCQEWFVIYFLLITYKNIVFSFNQKHYVLFSLDVSWSRDPVCHGCKM